MIGKDGRIVHAERVREFMDEPDYGQLIEAAKGAVAEQRARAFDREEGARWIGPVVSGTCRS